MARTRKRRIFGFLFFVLLGIGIGLFVRFEQWTARQLMALLADEVHTGTEGCTLTYDKADFSFLRLLAVTKNVTVNCQKNGLPVDALHFDTITAKVGLRKILSLVVTLDEIKLSNGYAKGVTPKSATYKFIDYVSKPVSAERAKQVRIRLELNTLLVENSKIFEDLGKNLLYADGVSLKVSYDQNRDAILKPRIETLNYISRGKTVSELPLGVVTGDVKITDTTTELHNIVLHRDDHSVTTDSQEIIGAKNGLSGTGGLAFGLDYLGIPDWIAAKVKGDFTASGSLGSPVLKGTFSLPTDQTAVIDPGGVPILTLKSLTSDFTVDVNEGEPIVILPAIEGTNSTNGDSVKTITPLRIEHGNLSGAFKLHSDAVVIGSSGVEFKNIDTDLTVTGPLGETKTECNGTVENVNALGATVRGVSFSANGDGGIFSVTANSHAGQHGTVTLKSIIDASAAEPKIKSAEYTVTNYPAYALYQEEVTSADENKFLISGTGTASGLFDPAKLELDAKGSALSTIIPFQPDTTIQLKIRNGEMALTSTDGAKVLDATLALGLTPDKNIGKLKVLLNGKNIAPLRQFNCSNVAATLNYQYPRGDFFIGSGSLGISTLQLGCDRVAVNLASPATIPITNGRYTLSKIGLQALQSNLVFSGYIRPDQDMNVSISGTLPMQTLESVVPAVDELSGSADINITLTGPTKKPIIAGNAALKNILLAFEKSETLLEKLSGNVVLSGEKITFDGVRGSLNGGELIVSGNVLPLDMANSSIAVTTKGSAFSPAKGFSFLGDSSLSLKSKNGVPTLSGELTITSADFEKKLDIVTLAQEITKLLFTSQRTAPLIAASGPDLPLDIKLIAKRNIFAVTNFFGAELKADLSIQGTMAKPDVIGSVESLSGWFGLREHRFDLTSGTVRFFGQNQTPELNVIGESLVRSNAGDIVNVYLEASGKITEPKVVFSSDTGLAQRDILALLTASGQTMQQTAVNTIGRDYQVGGISLLDGVPILSYSKFLRYLSQVDSISIEPQFNIQTGQIEPTISATKNITDSLYLLGQGYIGNQSTDTKIGAVYNLMPYLNVAGLFTNSTFQQNVALEVNSTLTVLAQQKKFIAVTLSGNNLFSDQEIRKAIRLTPASRIPPEEMENIRQGIRRFYRQRGYFDARIKSVCSSDGEYCRSATLDITEGQLSTISELSVEDPESGSKPIPNDLVPAFDSDTPALTDPLVRARQDVMHWLRANGYISARVEALYEKTDQPLKRRMTFRISRGRPVTFHFNGNKVFSDDDFFNTINFYERKVPFGNNTINILSDNITQLYREAGYLDVDIQKSTNTDPKEGRVSYDLSITEGTAYTATKAKLAGLHPFEQSILESAIEKQGLKFSQNIFYPKTLLKESLELNGYDLVALAKKEGFDNCTVAIDFERDQSSQTVTPLYVVEMGERSPGLEVRYSPATSPAHIPTAAIELPKPPKAPVYPIALKEYRDDIIKSLYEQGYREPNLSEIHSGTNILSISIDEGPVTEAGSITIAGSQDIAEEKIKELLHITPGEPLKTQSIRSVKQKLLNLGLFSRVDITEIDSGDPTIKNLQIRVFEKPLNTLDIGGGYNTELGAHIFAEGSDRSLFQDGRSLTLRLDAYVNAPHSTDTISRGIAALKYTDPTLFDSKYTFSEDLRYQKLNAPTQEFDLDRSSLTSGLYRSWESGLTASIGHTILSEDLKNVSPDVILDENDTGNVRLSYLSSTLTLDKRDNPLNPFSGYSVTLDGRVSSPVIGSDASYAGTGLRITDILPFSIKEKNFAFAQSIHGAFTDVFGGDQYVPISQRYYLGGRNSVRGYKENSLGPLGTSGGVIGGESLLQGSLELQYRPYESLSFDTFLDGGNVYLPNHDDTFLHYSTGVGLRFLSPIGPVGLDVGFPIDRRPEDSPWRVHFNIGTNF